MAIDQKFLNILAMGLALMLVFTSFQTLGNVEVFYCACSILVIIFMDME